MKKSYLIVGLIIVVGAIILFSGGNDESADIPDNPAGDEVTNGGAMAEGVIITYTDEGFAPATLTIKKGDKVTFRNGSSVVIWPATAIHPTHTVYPGSDIEKCGTAEEVNIFDACREIAPGSSYSFTFNEAGRWNYHNHKNVSKFGSIVVEAQ